MSAGSRPRVTVGIVSWNGREHLATCLAALAEQQDPQCTWEIAVWDNGSTDGSDVFLREQWPAVRVEAHPVNLGFCAGYNRLFATTDAEYLVLLNNDTRPRPDWLRSLVAALDRAEPDVAAVSGLILDWEGERLDFARGLLTFDGHAFQRGFHRPLTAVQGEIPEAGSELPFACGGNAIVRRRSFFEAGGFDTDYFAYFEDVDLGWRLWSGGERVVFAPDAVVHHRSSATSDRLGVFNRGFLFERNALWTAHKNLDEELWPRLMPAILLTFLSRAEAMLAENNPGGEHLRVDPYARSRAAVPVATASPIAGSRWRRRWRDLRRSRGPALDAVDLSDPRSIAQLRAAHSFLSRLEESAGKRQAVQSRRRRSDRDYLARFPLHVIPTYPGDERLFASPAFRDWLPADIPFVWSRLDEVMDRS